MIVAGDVGGTKTRLSVYRYEKGQLIRGVTETASSKDAAHLAEIVVPFLKRHDISAESACFGIPGPVINGTVKVTNLPWELSERDLVERTGIPKIKLVNDLAATVAAVPYFSPDDLVCLHEAKPHPGAHVYAMLAPGTGCGQGYLINTDGRWHPLPSEGGHTDFAPTNETEIELLRYLRRKLSRVSYERILCGPGLVNIYQFLKETGRATEPTELAERFAKEDPAAVIAHAGQDKLAEICTMAIDIFCSVLGARAGDMVLNYMATGGLYFGGGIPPKLLSKLKEGDTIASYLNKGRLSAAVKDTPVFVVKDDHAALLGAANIAYQMVKVW